MLRYRLTGNGWLQALDADDETQVKALEAQIATFAAYFKSKGKRRANPEIVTLSLAASESGLSEGWLFNAIEAKLFEEKFGRRGVK